jgi:hypothetical protein
MADHHLPGVSVAIIGSFRQHYVAVLKAVHTFRDAGWIVTSPLGTDIIREGIEFVRFTSDTPGWNDPTVQSIALHRILRADMVYVVAPEGYVGRTTCYEVGRAVQANRPLFFSEHPKDLPLAVPEARVREAATVVELLRNTSPPKFFDGDQSAYAELERRLLHGDFVPD